MKTLALTFTETFSLKRIKEWWLNTDRVLVAEFFIAVLLIFMKVYVNSQYIYEKNKALKNEREIKLEESQVKLMKLEVDKYKNLERLKALSKSLSMEENIDVIIVK
ncbi:MAG: hypothetical protein OHK0040_05280 [bacterium]